MRKHVCIYGRKCWCGASAETTVLHDRAVVAGVGGKSGWPMKSESMAVAADQIQEEANTARKMGVPTDFTKDGRPILTSRAHMKAYMKIQGYHERSSCRMRGRECA